MIEPIRPSVCRNARRNTARKVSAVRIARAEYQGCPPRVVRGSACHAWTASAVNQTVKLPRWRRPASYSRQFVTLRFCRGIWWRRSWFSLKGTLGIRGQVRGRPATPARPAAPPARSVQQRLAGNQDGDLFAREASFGRFAAALAGRAGQARTLALEGFQDEGLIRFDDAGQLGWLVQRR